MAISRNPDTGGITGTIKIYGGDQFTIENCGTPDCHLVLTKADASASHPPIDESNTMADSQLPTEVESNLFLRVGT